MMAVTACMYSVGQTDILDARTNYSDDDEVTVTGIVTSGDEFGSVRYIQDGTAGIAIYPGTDWSGFDEPVPGDEMTVTGILSTFSGLLEVGPDLSAVTIISSGNTLPDPQLMMPSEVDEDDEGELVLIENCLFSSAGATFTGNSTYTFQSNGEQGVIYVRSSNPLVGQQVPWGNLSLVGVASQFSNNGVGGYQILPRGASDLMNTSSINIASLITVDNITTESFDVHWQTDVDGTTVVEYGLTNDLGTEQSIVENTTVHDVSLVGLDPATVYFIRVSSTNGVDTAYSIIRPHITRSNSSGDITVYFTNNVETSVATDEEAIGLFSATNDTLAAYISRATTTLDIAMYNINDQTIVNAINAAYDDGVEIRYIAQGTNANIGVLSFDEGIPVLMRPDDNGSGMHNKFVIIDADIEDKATLITGSTNFTTENLVSDFNNIIIFQEQSLCRGYELEFNEMWGSETNIPDADAARFGADKIYNTPSTYYSGDVLVEAYFSPSDFVNQEILNTINETDEELDLALLVLTRDDLGNAILDVNNSFFSYARGIIEQVSSSGSEFDYLVGEGVELYSHEGISGQFHHKYCIVDHDSQVSDPTVLTGSHNWSSSADSFNDENTVVVHDARVSNLYYQEFIASWMLFVGIDEIPLAQTALFPNPTSNHLNVTWSGELAKAPYRITNLMGQVVKLGWINGFGNSNYLLVNDLPSGSYLFEVIDSRNHPVQFIVE